MMGKKMVKKCALMECEVSKQELTLGELKNRDDFVGSKVRKFIKQGFTENDTLCEECFLLN